MHQWAGQYLLEHLHAKDSPVHDEGDLFVLRPIQNLARPREHTFEALTQVGKIVSALAVNSRN